MNALLEQKNLQRQKDKKERMAAGDELKNPDEELLIIHEKF